MFHAGVCALALGNSIIEADIESIKNIAITIVTILFLAICIFIFLQFLFLLSKKHKEHLSARFTLFDQ
jgi:hypothetical protein